MVLLAMGVLFLAITAFVFLQHRGLFAGFAKFARRLIPEKWLSTLVARASMIDDSVGRHTATARLCCAPACCALPDGLPARARFGS